VSPLPGYNVIPDGWASHHRPVAEKAMNLPVRIVRDAGPPPYPLPEGWTGDELVHETVCRLQQLNRSGSAIPADQPTQLHTYQISIPYDGVPPLRVGEGGDTAIVAGRRYQIHQQLQGSYLFEWDLICQDNLTQNQEAT
jgi:hypothetical protein